MHSPFFVVDIVEIRIRRETFLSNYHGIRYGVKIISSNNSSKIIEHSNSDITNCLEPAKWVIIDHLCDFWPLLGPRTHSIEQLFWDITILSSRARVVNLFFSMDPLKLKKIQWTPKLSIGTTDVPLNPSKRVGNGYNTLL